MPQTPSSPRSAPLVTVRYPRVLGVKVMQHLEAIDHISYVRYASIYREFQELGEFISEINSLETRVPRDVKQPELFRKM